MYKPLINTVLVEIVVDEWAPGNVDGADAMLGRSYREGKVVSVGALVPTDDYPVLELSKVAFEGTKNLIGKDIMWNHGVEAGTIWEEDARLYGFIYWWDIRGVKT